MTPEGRVKVKIFAWFKRLLAWSYAPVQNGMGVVGIPDRVGCIPVVVTPAMVGRRIGLFVAVEAKAPGKKANTTPNQVAQLDGIRAAGGIAWVVDNPEVDLADVERMLHGSV